MFHSKPIAISLMLFFISSVPLLYQISDNQKNNLDNNVSIVNIEKNQEENKVNEEWEEATLDDLESGNYEPV